MFAAHLKREMAETVLARRLAMITGAWANTNFDMEENDRGGWLESIDESTDQMIDAIYGSTAAAAREEIPWEDPLFGKMKETVYADPLSEDEIERAKLSTGKFEVKLEVDQA